MKKCQLLPQLFWSSKITLSILCEVIHTHKRNTLIVNRQGSGVIPYGQFRQCTLVEQL